MANNEYNPVTAADVVAPVADNSVDEAAAKRARDAGVIDPAFVDYEKALENYQGRSDVETLERRRARENGTDFSDASFRRTLEGLEADESGADGGLVTSDKATLKNPTKK